MLCECSAITSHRCGQNLSSFLTPTVTAQCQQTMASKMRPSKLVHHVHARCTALFFSECVATIRLLPTILVTLCCREQHGSNEDSKMLLLPHLPDGSAYFVPTNPDLFAFSQQLKKGKGLLIVGAVVKGDLSNNGRDRKSAEKCLELCMRSGKTLVDPSGKHDAAADCDERSSDGLVNSCNDVATIVSFCGPAEFGGFAQVCTTHQHASAEFHCAQHQSTSSTRLDQ